MTDHILKIQNQLYSYRLCCWILFKENGGKSITFNSTGPSPYLKSYEGLLTPRCSDVIPRRNLVSYALLNTQQTDQWCFATQQWGKWGSFRECTFLSTGFWRTGTHSDMRQWWDSTPRLHSTIQTHPHRVDWTYQTLHEDTLRREYALREQGYCVTSLWEHEFDREVKKEHEFQSFSSDL